MRRFFGAAKKKLYKDKIYELSGWVELFEHIFNDAGGVTFTFRASGLCLEIYERFSLMFNHVPDELKGGFIQPVSVSEFLLDPVFAFFFGYILHLLDLKQVVTVNANGIVNGAAYLLGVRYHALKAVPILKAFGVSTN